MIQLASLGQEATPCFIEQEVTLYVDWAEAKFTFAMFRSSFCFEVLNKDENKHQNDRMKSRKFFFFLLLMGNDVFGCIRPSCVRSLELHTPGSPFPRLKSCY